MKWIIELAPLVSSLLSLTAIIIVILRTRKSNRDEVIHSVNDYLRQRLPDVIWACFDDSKRLDSFLKNRIRSVLDSQRSYMPSNNGKKHVQSVITPSISQEQMNEICRRVYEEVKASLKNEGNIIMEIVPPKGVEMVEQSSKKEEEEKEEKKVVESSKIMYASSVDDNGVFYSVTSEPDSDTIFTFTVESDGQNAKFGVYKNAEKKLKDAADFLNGACSVQRLGTSSIRTDKQGVATLMSDGKWQVEEQAKIIFE